MSQAPRVMSLVWNLIRGGTEGQCARVAMACAREGGTHRVGVFRQEGFFLPEVERQCGSVYHFNVRRRFSWNTFLEIRRLARYLKKERIELVHLWDMDACLYGSRAARLARIPYLTSRRDLGEIYPRYKMRALRQAEKEAAGVVVNAVTIRNQAIEEGVPGNHIFRIPNLLDVNEFDLLASGAGAAIPDLAGGLRVVMVARLDPEKDVFTLIRAASIILQSRKDVHFYIVGDGPDRAEAEHMMAELKLGEWVHFMGAVDHVPVLLKQMDIGVLCPKSNEGLSNTILEYMAASLPVVATRCGGNSEIVVNHYNGEITPIGNSRELADALLRFLGDPELRTRYGRMGRSAIERQHLPHQVAGRFQDCYTTALLPRDESPA